MAPKRAAIFGHPISSHIPLPVDMPKTNEFTVRDHIPNVIKYGRYLPRRVYLLLHCLNHNLIISFHFKPPKPACKAAQMPSRIAVASATRIEACSRKRVPDWMNPPFQERSTKPAAAPVVDLEPSKLSLMKPPRGRSQPMNWGVDEVWIDWRGDGNDVEEVKAEDDFLIIHSAQLRFAHNRVPIGCLLYTSDAADE